MITKRKKRRKEKRKGKGSLPVRSAYSASYEGAEEKMVCEGGPERLSAVAARLHTWDFLGFTAKERKVLSDLSWWLWMAVNPQLCQRLSPVQPCNRLDPRNLCFFSCALTWTCQLMARACHPPRQFKLHPDSLLSGPHQQKPVTDDLLFDRTP